MFSLFGRAGQKTPDLTRPGFEVLNLASREPPPEAPALPPEIAPHALEGEVTVEFDLRPVELDLGEGPGRVSDRGSGPPVRAPVPLTVPWLRYPRKAIEDEVSGVVRLGLWVRADGKVGRVEVVQGLRPDCDRAAVEAARRLVFEPALEGGRRVDAWVEYEIAFDMGGP